MVCVRGRERAEKEIKQREGERERERNHIRPRSVPLFFMLLMPGDVDVFDNKKGDVNAAERGGPRYNRNGEG